MQSGRVFILDDDPVVGELLRKGAQTCGFEAFLHSTVDGFLDALADGAPTHLVIDLTLPGSSGDEVLVAVAARGCRARVIVCSGTARHELDAALAHARSLGLATAGALPKPFRLADLRALLAVTG